MSRDDQFQPAARALSDQFWSQLKRGSAFSLILALLVFAPAVVPGLFLPALSAVAAVGVVWVSFAASCLVLALLAPQASEHLIFVGMGVYVLKFFVVGALLLTLGIPGWVEPIWAGLAAILAVLLWQFVQFQAQARARVPLYTDVKSLARGEKKDD